MATAELGATRAFPPSQAILSTWVDLTAINPGSASSLASNQFPTLRVHCANIYWKMIASAGLGFNNVLSMVIRNTPHEDGVRWHSRVAALLLRELPQNPHVKHHVRTAIREASLAVLGKHGALWKSAPLLQ